MKTKNYLLTDGQAETLKSLLTTTVEEVKGDVYPDKEYIEELTSIHDSLILGAPDLDALNKEIHQLKNQVQGLKMELHLKERS